MSQLEPKVFFLQRSTAEKVPEGFQLQETENIEDFVRAGQCSLPPIDAEKHLQKIIDCILPPK